MTIRRLLQASTGWVFAILMACGSSGGTGAGPSPSDSSSPSPIGDAAADVEQSASGGIDATAPAEADANAAAGSEAAADQPIDGGPAFSGPRMAGTVTVNRSRRMGRLAPGFAGFSFEKTHMTDGFFTASNGPLVSLFRLLGAGTVRIGANDVDNSTWVATALPVSGGNTSFDVGTSDVDALATFLTATGWKVIYGVSMRTATAPSVAESVYVSGKLGPSLDSIEIGNEINLFSGNPRMEWESFETAIRSALPNVKLAGPGAAGGVTSFTVPFANAEASKLALLTQHYYKGAASSKPTIADILAIDPSVVTQSQDLSAAAQTDKIGEGFRWGEMNSYSGHGAAGVSDVFASALWSLDFMFTTAEYGAGGVNFHGGGQNMDGNVCKNGVASCTKPFRYSPIDEVDSKVTAAAPLYYGMLFVARSGVGDMLSTTATAGGLAFSGYCVNLADGSTNVVLVNKDATTGIEATVDVGVTVTSADATYLLAPSLTATTGVTFAGAGVTAAGTWAPGPPFALATSGVTVSVLVPPASAVLVHAH